MMTTKEAAKKLFVCDAAVRKYIREGIGKDKEKLNAIVIMRGARAEYRIKAEDLELYRIKHLSPKKS